GMFECDLLNDLRRVEEPISVVLPVLDEFGKGCGHAIADGVDVHDVSLEPCRSRDDSLCHVAGWDHGRSPEPSISRVRSQSLVAASRTGLPLPSLSAGLAPRSRSSLMISACCSR